MAYVHHTYGSRKREISSMLAYRLKLRDKSRYHQGKIEELDAAIKALEADVLALEAEASQKCEGKIYKQQQREYIL